MPSAPTANSRSSGSTSGTHHALTHPLKASPNPDSIDLGEIWATIRDNRRTIVGCALLVLVLVTSVTLVSRMTFKTTGSLYLGEVQQKTKSGSNSDALDFLSGPQGELGTEIEILKSETLVTRAILESGLNAPIVRYGSRPPRYYKWRASGRDPHLIDQAVDEVTATDTSLARDVRKPQTFKIRFSSATNYELWSEPHWWTQGKVGELLGRLPFHLSAERELLAKGKLSEPLNVPGLVHLRLVAGKEARPQPGAEYGMVVRPLDDVLDDVTDSLNVATPKGATPGQAISVVKIEFIDSSPSVAKNFLERLMRGYLDQRQLWKTEEATAAESFVTNQLHGLQESLDSAEKQLANYKESSGVVVLSDEAKAMIEQLGNFEQQRVAVRLQVSALRDIQRMLKNRDSAPLEAYLLGEAQDTVLTGLGDSLTKAQEELKKAEQQFQSDAPAVREQRAHVEAQLEMVRNYVQTRSARAQEQLASLNGIIAQSENKLRNVPRAELELAQLSRHTEVLSKIYSYLLERQQQAAIVKAATISDNRILDLPKIPYREDSPKLALRALLSSILGLLLGTLFVFGRRRFASTFQSASEVRTRLEGVPIFSVVPKRPNVKLNRANRRRVRALDVLAGAAPSAFTEAFRLLRANIYRSSSRSECKVILITSPNPGDGKTLCTLTLAATLARDNKRVLVIDGDIHKPSHHELLGLWQEPGLTSVLSGQNVWRDLVNSVPLSGGELHAIAAGDSPSGAADCFSSIEATNFFAEVRRCYDFVLVDSPSFPLASDPLLMCMHADRVLTVVRLGNTERALADEHVRRLGSLVSCAIVLNDADSTVKQYGYVHLREHGAGRGTNVRARNFGSAQG